MGLIPITTMPLKSQADAAAAEEEEGEKEEEEGDVLISISQIHPRRSFCHSTSSDCKYMRNKSYYIGLSTGGQHLN